LAVSAATGTLFGDQLAATDQLPPAVFVQVTVSAWPRKRPGHTQDRTNRRRFKTEFMQ
jgi:hypothetical protein